MNSGQRSAQRSFRRVQEFLAAHPQANAPVSLGTQSAELDDVVSKLSQEAVDQEAGDRLTQAETKRQRALRDTLWSKYMLLVSRIAREAFGVPGVDRALRMPRKSADNEALLAAAGGMAEAAEKEKAVFVKHGLPATFVDELRAATSTLSEALGARVESVRRRVTATKAVDVQLRRGRRAVRLLNAILSPRLASDPELLAAWDNARRVKEVAGGRIAAAGEEDQAAVVKVA
jgi:hypothetical protein